jgi:methylglutaconyl-CoA hydratase
MAGLPRRTCRIPQRGRLSGSNARGGAGVAAACDLVIAGESAQLGYPEVELGLVPAMVGALLRRTVGEKVAFELLATGLRVGAAEAKRLGLVNHILPDAGLAAGSLAIARDLARCPHSALHLTKRLLYGLDGLGFEEAIGRGAEINVLARRSACVPVAEWSRRRR